MAVIKEYLFYYPFKNTVSVVNIYHFKAYEMNENEINHDAYLYYNENYNPNFSGYSKPIKESYYKLIDRGCFTNSRKGFSPINFYDYDLFDGFVREQHTKKVVYIGNYSSNFYNILKNHYENVDYINNKRLLEDEYVITLKNLLSDFYDLTNEGINDNKLYFSSNLIDKKVNNLINDYIKNDYNFLQIDCFLYCLIVGINYMNNNQNNHLGFYVHPIRIG